MEHSANGRPVGSTAEPLGRKQCRWWSRAGCGARRPPTPHASCPGPSPATSEGYGVLSGSDVVPRPGDVVMARVEHIGQHKAIELPDGRRATLFEGDDVIVAYGNRYAPDQFEAEVPAISDRPTSLPQEGSRRASVSKHASVAVATTLRPVGLLSDARGVVTLRRERAVPVRSPPGGPRAGASGRSRSASWGRR